MNSAICRTSCGWEAVSAALHRAEIGKLIISGELKDGDNVRIDAKDGELKITVK